MTTFLLTILSIFLASLLGGALGYNIGGIKNAPAGGGLMYFRRKSVAAVIGILLGIVLCGLFTNFLPAIICAAILSPLGARRFCRFIYDSKGGVNG